MRRRRCEIGFGVFLVACGLTFGSGRAPAAEGAMAPTPPSLRIGVAKSLFRDTPSSLIDVLSEPLRALMEEQTGLRGELRAVEAMELARQLKEKTAQVGVFHGYEFGWARQQFPDLKALVVCTTEHPVFHAHLIVRKDSPASSCGDLKGKVLSLPSISRGHLHLYLERRCPAASSDPRSFFREVRRPTSAEEALDDVVYGDAQAALVDRLALDEYQKSRPARLNKLRVLHQSEAFPPSVIAYHAGSLDEATLKRFREGLLQARGSARGQTLLKMCRITGFAPASAEFELLLGEIIKGYPPPAKAKEEK
jgi:ABC-type phosphate/phosphonate transport system substrate-binding protein